MFDRIPTPGQEGRMLITPENGTAPFYATIAMADNPTEEGTPLNKATLLKDATAALFGFNASAVPDDVFAWLGKYNQHWWSVLHGQASIRYEEKRTLGTSTQYLYWLGPNDQSATVKYSPEIQIDQSTGSISLVNPVSLTISQSQSLADKKALLETLYGAYVTEVPELGDNSTGTSTDVSSRVFFIPDGADYFAYSADYQPAGFGPSGFYHVTAQIVNIPAGATTYEHSADRNAYPDSGTVDGLTYEYLGVPFSNAVTAPKIATGSYSGTGTYGEDNPNSLTFDFVPKFVVVLQEDTYSPEVLLLVNGLTRTGILEKSSSYWELTVSWSDNTVSWYAPNGTDGGDEQMNTSGITYRYCAIG